MRMMLMTAAGAILLAGLAGCNRGNQANQSSQVDRGAMRQLLLVGCRNGDANARAQMNQAGISVEQFCTCAVDRYLQSASDEQLQRVYTNPSDARGMEAASQQCVAQMMSQAAAPAGNEAGAPGAETPGAEAEEENTAGGK
jgi:hypothetical protein